MVDVRDRRHARPGRGRAARTGGTPSSRSRPRAGSGRRGARSPPRVLADQVVGDDLLRERPARPRGEPRPCSPSCSRRSRERCSELLAVAVRFGLQRRRRSGRGRRRDAAVACVVARRRSAIPSHRRRATSTPAISGRSCSSALARARELADPPDRGRPRRRAVARGDPDRHGAAALGRDRADDAGRAVQRLAARRDGARRRGRRRCSPASGRARSTSGLLGARARPRLRGSSSRSATTSSAGRRATRTRRRARRRRGLARRRVRRRSPPTCSSRAARRSGHGCGPRSPPSRSPGVALGLAYVCLLVAFDHGRVSIVAPLNATQSLWAVVLRRSC